MKRKERVTRIDLELKPDDFLLNESCDICDRPPLQHAQMVRYANVVLPCILAHGDDHMIQLAFAKIPSTPDDLIEITVINDSVLDSFELTSDDLEYGIKNKEGRCACAQNKLYAVDPKIKWTLAHNIELVKLTVSKAFGLDKKNIEYRAC